MDEKLCQLIARFLAALGHENRVKILEVLKERERCNCEIYPLLNLEQSNLSRHMKVLLEAGVVESHKQGLRTFYKIADPRVIDILELTTQIIKDHIQKDAQLLSTL